MAGKKDVLESLDGLSQGDDELRQMVQEASVNAEVAQLIYAARTQAGLTAAAACRAHRHTAACYRLTGRCGL